VLSEGADATVVGRLFHARAGATVSNYYMSHISLMKSYNFHFHISYVLL